MRYCTIENCNRLLRAVGRCELHYQEYRSERLAIPCTATGCDKLSTCKGLCNRHYQIARIHDDPNYVRVSEYVQGLERPFKEKESRPNISEFMSWQNMKNRCYNPNDVRYDRYGGRGIKVYDKWLYSFKYFLEDMGEKPTPKHTLDRINNDGNYEPDNCRWVTVRENNENRSISSPTPGVWYDRRTNRWHAMLKIGKVYKLKRIFKNYDDALNARKEAERLYLYNDV